MKDRTLRLLPVRIGSSPHLEGYENRAGVDNIQVIECLNIRSVFPLVRLGSESALLVKVFNRWAVRLSLVRGARTAAQRFSRSW
jgi:hypothetical protein